MAELIQQIIAILRTSGWKQTEAAEHCGVARPRINDIRWQKWISVAL